MMYSFILLALSFPRSLSTNIHWVWPSWTQKIKVRLFAFLKQDKLFPSRPNHLSWSSKVRGHSLSDKVASVSYADSCKSQKVDLSNSEVNRPSKYMFCWKGLLGSEGWGVTLLLPLLPSYTPPLPFFQQEVDHHIIIFTSLALFYSRFIAPLISWVSHCITLSKFIKTAILYILLQLLSSFCLESFP